MVGVFYTILIVTTGTDSFGGFEVFEPGNHGPPSHMMHIPYPPGPENLKLPPLFSQNIFMPPIFVQFTFLFNFRFLLPLFWP